MANEQNLKPYKKGESGNPDGRPLGSKNLKTLYKEAMIRIATERNLTPEEVEMQLHKVGLDKSFEGNYNFYKDYTDRVHGKAEEIVKVDMKVGGLTPEQKDKIDKLFK